MPLIRRYSDIAENLGDLYPAEEKLIKACRNGEASILGVRPEEGDKSREVRANLLRYLILGGCDSFRVEGRGVQLAGAFVSGHLDLSYERARKMTALVDCTFAEVIDAMQARFNLLTLKGSQLKGLNAERVDVKGNVVLDSTHTSGGVRLSGARIGGQLDFGGAIFSLAEGDALNAQGVEVAGGFFLDGARATGTVRLANARIGGQFNCTRAASFSNPKGDALNAQGLIVTGDVLLRGLTAEGTVRLSGARIEGQLECDCARFSAAEGEALDAQGVDVTDHLFLRGLIAKGAVRVHSARIGGQLDCTGARFSALKGIALDLQRAHVEAGLLWRNVTVDAGHMDLTAARSSDLVDDLACWPPAGRLILDGFTYDRISGAPTDAARRLKWLAQGSTWNGEFFPQPYTQLANVLREMGHDGEARTVLAARERLLRRDFRKTLRDPARHPTRNPLDWIGVYLLLPFHWLFADWLPRLVVGYGHHPFRSIWALVLLIAVTTVPAHRAWDEGSLAPNSGPVLVSPDWKRYTETEDAPALVWSGEVAPEGWQPPDAETEWEDVAEGRDWETFNAFAYAADVVIPIIDFGQTQAWAPSTTRGWWGDVLYWWRWLATLLGWIVTALGAAAITGIIRRD